MARSTSQEAGRKVIHASYAIEGTGLEKTFVKKRSVRELVTRPFRRAERIRALRGVDVRVPEGQIFGILGPNGAGKTTLLKILSCLVLPDRGEARVGGHDVREEGHVKRLIGLVHSDERSFYWRLSARENLRFFATLYDVPRSRQESRIDELLARVDMLEAADRRFSDYSSGMKQRVAIARALLHDPPILLMDEPTRSLDPGASLALRRFIQEELSGVDRKTILLATHNLHEAEVLCDQVAILMRGRVRQVGPVDEVRRWGFDDRRFELAVTDWPATISGPFEVVANEPDDGGRRVVVTLPAGSSLGATLEAVLAAGVEIRSCDRIDSDLEAAFARILESEGDDPGYGAP